MLLIIDTNNVSVSFRPPSKPLFMFAVTRSFSVRTTVTVLKKRARSDDNEAADFSLHYLVLAQSTYVWYHAKAEIDPNLALNV